MNLVGDVDGKIGIIVVIILIPNLYIDEHHIYFNKSCIYFKCIQGLSSTKNSICNQHFINEEACWRQALLSAEMIFVSSFLSTKDI